MYREVNMQIEWVKHTEISDKAKYYSAQYKDKALKVIKSGNYWLPIIDDDGVEIHLAEVITFKEAKHMIDKELNIK